MEREFKSKALIEYFGKSKVTDKEIRETLMQKPIKINCLVIGTEKAEGEESLRQAFGEIGALQAIFPDISVDIELINVGIGTENFDDILRFAEMGDLNKNQIRQLDISYQGEQDFSGLKGFEKLQSLTITPPEDAKEFDLSNVPQSVERIINLSNGDISLTSEDTITINDVSELNLEQLQKLKEEGKVTRVAIKVREKSFQIYSVEEYEEILTELYKLTDGIDDNLSEEEKIEMVFKNVRQSLRYDHKAAKDHTDYSRETEVSSRSLKRINKREKTKRRYR